MLPLTVAFAAPTRPNIILLMADDLGWGDVGFNGGTIIQTPHLDAMADAGLKFNRFYAAAPVCSPTRGSCLTGRHPYRYGILSANIGHLKEGEWTLAELLKQHGYRTGHFGKWHLGTLSPDYSGKKKRQPKLHYATPGMNGFDEWFSTEFAVATWDPYDPNNSHLGNEVAPDTRALYWHNGVNVKSGLEGDDSRIIMDKAIPFIRDAVAAKQPFFSVVWFHAPHTPVVGGPEYRKRYDEYDEEAQHYYACVTALDEQVGRLRAILRELNVAENTMVFFCSDNGPEGNQPDGRFVGATGPFRGRKRSLFEGGIRVPALLEWPAAVKAGAETDYPAVTSDYLPTILAVLGVEKTDTRPLDGLSLLPAIRDGVTERAAPIAFETLGGVGTAQSRKSPRIGLIDNRYKLLTDFSDSGEEDLLYDLVGDHGETNNLAGEKADIVKTMKATLANWRESCRTSAAGADYLRNGSE
ncbi:MAG: sulfatase-like hydrolase/transferase [Candidatus Hydrogenedentes bacterium]|nr:sulfatase-like hydrolase/transferase [Candidatus Hydrogenedentota bacterium]